MARHDLRFAHGRRRRQAGDASPAGSTRRRDHGGLVFIDLRDAPASVQLVVNPERAPARPTRRTSSATSSSFQARGRGRRAARPSREPEHADRRDRGAGRRRSRSSRARRRCRSSSTTRTSTTTLRLRYRWLDLRRDRMQRNIRLRAHDRRRRSAAPWTRRLRRHPDADPLEADARGRARLPRAGRACSPAASTRCRSRRRSSSSSRDRRASSATTRSRSACATRISAPTASGVHPARPRDGVPRPEESSTLMEEMVVTVWRECLGVEPATPFPRLTLAEADRRFGIDKPDLRFGLELEDATEADARLRVRRLRAVPRPCASSRAARVLAQELADARGGREGVGREGSRIPRPRRERGGALADREVPLRGRARGVRAASPARRCSSPPTTCAMTLARARCLRTHLGNELGLTPRPRGRGSG